MKKDKVKKIMAGVGVGCAILSSGFVMTGCSVDLTEEQKNKILTVVDNSDKFMNETLDILQDSNSKIDRDTAVKLYEKSVARLIVNYDNVWDNMKFSVENKYFDAEDCNQYSETKIITMSNGNKYMLLYYDSNDDNVVELHSITDNIQENGEMFTGSFSYYNQKQFQQILNIGEINIDNIVDWNVLENGNYCISAVGMGDVGDGQGEQLIIVDCEISKDAYLISKSYSYVSTVSSNQKDVSSVISTLKFEYGTLNETQVQQDIDNYNQNN